MEPESFVVAAVFLLLVTSVTVALAKRFGLGSVIGLLVAGVIVGPHSPGPALTHNVEDLRRFTELGVVLLLFVIGLELQPARLAAMRREVFGVGSLQIALTGAAVTAYALPGQESWQAALVIGLALALSSTAFVMQLLRDRGEVSSRHGTTAFAVLLMQDLAVVPIMALVPLLAGGGALSAGLPIAERLALIAGMLALVVGFGRYVAPFALERLARQGNREGFLLVVMLAVFLAAWAVHRAGVSMALGAFMMGMLLSGSRYHLQIQALIEPFKGLLMSVFFVAVGMSVDLDAIGARPGAFARDVAVIVLLKILAMGVVGWLFGLGRAVTVRVSFLLAQGGEFGFVLFGSARALGVLDDASFVTGIGVISVSMLVTPLLARLGEAIARRWERTPAAGPEDLREPAAGGGGAAGHHRRLRESGTHRGSRSCLQRHTISRGRHGPGPRRPRQSRRLSGVLRRHRGPGAVGGGRRRAREPGGADDRPGASRAPGRHAAAQRLARTPGDRPRPGPRGERQAARGRGDPGLPGGGGEQPAPRRKCPPDDRLRRRRRGPCARGRPDRQLRAGPARSGGRRGARSGVKLLRAWMTTQHEN